MSTKIQEVEVGFNTGNTMLTLSQDYKNIKSVVAELAQNAIDANAKRVLVIINLKSMSLNVFDDGIGCSKEEFAHNVQNIGSRQKSDGKGGKYGTGNLSPLGIMGEGGAYKFISRPVDKPKITDPYFSASIDYDTLKNSKKVSFKFIDLPTHTFRDYDVAPAKAGDVTSYVKCTGIQKSAVKSWLKEDPNVAVADMCEFIVAKYGPLIQMKDAKITIYLVPQEGGNVIKDVEITEFGGHKEELITIQTPYGPVVFEMFLTSIPINDPIIRVRHKQVVDIDMRNMDVWAKHKKILGAGYIQGYIHINFCEVNAERSDLLDNDERASFVDAVEEFIADSADDYVAKAKKSEELDRRKVLLNKAMKSIDDWIKEDPSLLGPEFSGAISSGHSDVKGRKTYIGKRLSPEGDDGDDEEYRPRLYSKKKAQSEHKNMKHNTTDAPEGRGTERCIVKGQCGVNATFVEDMGMWRKKLEGGLLFVNISHKDYVRCAQIGSTQEQEYFKLLMTCALTESKLKREFGDDTADKFREGFESIAIIGIITH
jgi:hypothetical protein